MKFLTKKTKNATIKVYACPVCNYKVKTIVENGEEKKVVGDKDFVLFPFTSLAALDRTTKELCACPMCNTIQYVDRVENEPLFFENDSEYIS